LVTAAQVAALASWDPPAESGTEIQFTPARVLLQDFTGVPCVVDLAMREQFKPGQSRASLGLTGEERYSITGLEGTDPLPHEVTVRAEKNGDRTEFTAAVRMDTPAEAAYFRHGGILQFVLRQLRKHTTQEGDLKCQPSPSTDWEESAERP
jgi:aconitase A